MPFGAVGSLARWRSTTGLQNTESDNQPLGAGEGRFPDTRLFVWPGRNPCGDGGICKDEAQNLTVNCEFAPSK
jgi:hypothetical protein